MAIPNLQIDATRLWDSLMEMAQIGATPGGGVCRLALTEEDRQARDLLVSWCERTGCTIRIDQAGNIFARRAGRDPQAAAVMVGSHLDSQPSGGKYDGPLGVLAGLEVLRCLSEADLLCDRPIELVMWTNEEGSRFPPAMLGSAAWTGLIPARTCLETPDRAGIRMEEALRDIDYAGPHALGEPLPACYLELHIEQGPVLESESIPIGLVTRAMGQRWFEIDLRGMEAHAGPTPMTMRRDALVGAAELIRAVRRIGMEHLPDSAATCGALEIWPGSRNVIPGSCWMTVDLRHGDEEQLERMAGQLLQEVETVATTHRLDIEPRQIWQSPVLPFDSGCIAALREACARENLPTREMMTGAGHDAVNLARVVPSAMIFVPCKDGISHNEAESIEPEDASAGCRALLQAVLILANQP